MLLHNSNSHLAFSPGTLQTHRHMVLTNPMAAYDAIYCIKKTVWVSYLLSLVSARPTPLLVTKDPEDQIKISKKNE